MLSIGQSSQVDLVRTPFADYLVIAYKDPKGSEYEPGSFLNFSGDFVFSASDIKEIGINIEKFESENPDLQIDREKDITYLLDLPAGTIGEILSEGSIGSNSDIFRHRLGLFSRRMKHRGVETSIPSKEETLDIVRAQYRHAIWNQLIRRTSANYLDFDFDCPPSILLMDAEGRGFGIIDSNVNANCGYGTGNLYLYAIEHVSSKYHVESTTFERETLEVSMMHNANIQWLPLSAQNHVEMERLRKRGTILTLGNWPVYVDIKLGNPPMLE
ncbi:MAG: hypothetical protein HGA85_08715 [Nanoarchaeota archaeon]|nr:hypothetical protein [Nanoarchaeota archaeon]